jgi:hypothetical protein
MKAMVRGNCLAKIGLIIDFIEIRGFGTIAKVLFNRATV